MLHYKTLFIILPSGLQSCSHDEEIHEDDYYDDYIDEDDDGNNEKKEEDHSHQ
jgi:hypothetical protein